MMFRKARRSLKPCVVWAIRSVSSLLRNREIQLLVLFLSTICLIATGLAAIILCLQAAILVFITSALLIGCSLGFTAWRYREIEKLSSYLRRISSGDYTLDLRDNHEGELCY